MNNKITIPKKLARLLMEETYVPEPWEGELRVCPICGWAFIPSWEYQVCCSGECYSKEKGK